MALLVKKQGNNGQSDSPSRRLWVQPGQDLLLLQALESDAHAWDPVLLPTDWV